MSKKEVPDYTEDVVGFALEHLLAVASWPFLRFSIEPFSRAEERTHGADGRLLDHIEVFAPFYMQFKRPFAYPDTSTSKIIKDRKKLNLCASPRVLFFPLREKQPAHPDYQHNILFKLRAELLKNQKGDAAYVCPLFLNREAYRMQTHFAGLGGAFRRFLRHPPWYWEDLWLHDEQGGVSFNSLPTFKEHISIPPHALVANAKHSYSFTEHGDEVCFHSPAAIENGAISFNDWIFTLYRNFKNGDQQLTAQDSKDTLKAILEATGTSWKYDTDISSTKNWLLWGDYLKRNHQIEQFAFVRYRPD